ncbi:hypothetical protein BASA81_007341 [Batrachochytrium salamandrivorans]|nr:hypothetical protein BASA81_007341 [Batrachochytrium salamandrivorans]
MNYTFMAMQVLLNLNSNLIALLALLEEEENESLAPKTKRSRTWTPRPDWKTSPWYTKYLRLCQQRGQSAEVPQLL